MLATSLIELQQAERLLQLASNEADLVKEIQNQRPRAWCPLRHPDYLLLEIEGNFRIRPVQEQIAAIMENPPNNQNAVLQLSMGEGKSTVISPMVAASVADGLRLARVLVAKPQFRQMNEILISKLGGLLGRRVFYLPFARKINIREAEAQHIHKICTDCRDEGGVLLVQPEHILSLQLMAILKSTENDKSPELGQILLKTLTLFQNHSQDLIDESDENFSPKFELIYTKGKQGPIGFSPYRWLLIHELLSMVAKFAKQVQRELPLAIEIDDQHRDRFPRVRLLSEEAGAKLNSLIAAHVCRVGLSSGLAIGRQSHSVKDAILRYIIDRDVDISVIEKVQTSVWTDSTKDAILLLRGLLAGGVLAFALASKRWTVDYGLVWNRQPATKLAVPYRAKNVPSLASEFSHPDLQIILSTLSFYYGGMSDEDLVASLKHVSQSDQAKNEFANWTASTSLSEAFCTLDGLNLSDETRTQEVFSALRYSKGAIDYFLSRIVFPKAIKEFPSKLAASGWDIGRIKPYPTTGFSGTKDSSHALPLEMRQIEAPNQEHTDAMVLSNMLAEGNNVVLLSEMGHNGPCLGSQLIKAIVGMRPGVRVILDVGAQVLEMSNEQVAQAWLELTENHDKTEAALFCDEDDEFVVIDRRGHKEPLKTSPFAKQLDLCLIFMDQARCFGTDLQLPLSSRAAVTLGAKTTKDKLAQACMRMRKLGAGQTVVFCVPQEIEMRIREQPWLGSGPIEVSDILCWSIRETWTDCQQLIGVWAVQGKRYERQRILWGQSRDDERLCLSKDLAEKFLENEAQTLESRYKPDYVEPPSIAELPGDPSNLAQIVERCQKFHVQIQTASLQEQQERELAPELEEESQVQRVVDATPADHRLHPKVREFIENGCLPPSNNGFLWAFQTLENTTAATHFDVRKFPRQLRCTHDFASTVKEGAPSDAYQRGVQFVLTSHKAERRETIVVLISPYEAEKLYASIQASEHVLLRLYAPRQNQVYAPLNLDLFHIGKAPSNHPIPRDLMIQLNLFAGQLWFDSYQEYVDVCQYLCLTSGDPADGDDAAVDGFIEPGRRVRPHRGWTNFAESPVQFLKVLMAKIRYSGNSSIERTHVGKMLNGVILTEDDFEPRPKRKAESQLTREDDAEIRLFVRDVVEVGMDVRLDETWS
ncbi:putative very large low complexity protein [Hirsutella rhossiliensis]|uniref:ubiquitinyl hydrolase 1 n=1 Tax=Hirsutella rhossiliensis TaxID=111463 RepID=A0A9P8N4V8_9HYPO|nr:putative very large low complexity protein [Hirsutella rhossiliensis]KAH0965981.1 putative very large low complexity protein [Hirsutella rhossiliensis]